MPREGPIFRKFCFCIPLQSCLQIWATVKVMADLTISLFLGLMMLLLGPYDLHSKRLSTSHVFIILIIMLLIDGCFMVVLSVGLCTKNTRTLRIFYFYSICMTVTSVLLILGILFGFMDNFLHPNYEVIILAGLGGFINGAVDVAIILTLKSEMIKLRNKQQFEFIKLPNLNGEEEREKSDFEEEQISA